MNVFGHYLKNLRNEKSLSIRKASEKIGISHTYLDSLEKGFDHRTKEERKPTPEVLQKISDFYKVNYEHLLFLAGYISREVYQEQQKIKDDIKTHEEIIAEETEKLFSIEKNSAILRHKYADLKQKLSGSPDDENTTKLLNVMKNSIDSAQKKSETINFSVHKFEEHLKDLNNQLNKFNDLIEEKERANDINEEKNINDRILSEVRTLLNTNKGKWQEAKPEEINVMIEDQEKFLEGKEYNIEDLLLLDDYYIKYKGKVLMPDEKKKILDLINITFN